MKKGLLLWFAIVGLALPNVTKAAVTVTTSDGTVTVKADNAGELKTYLESATAEQLEELKANTIVFDGKFCAADLQTLSSKGCCVAKTVDMENAMFVEANTDASKTAFNTVDAMNNVSKNKGDIAYVGGTLYKANITETKTWVAVEESELPDNVTFQYSGFDDDAREENKSQYGNGQYVKLPSAYDYYKLVVTKEWVLQESVPEGTTFTNVSFTEEQMQDNINNVSDGAYVKFGDGENAKIYQKVVTREWVKITDSTEYDQWANVPNFTVDELNNHLNEDEGKQYKFPTAYNYYQMKVENEVNWEQQGSYTDGTTFTYYYSTTDEMNANNSANTNDTALVGGEEYIYDGSKWVKASEYTYVTQYSEMKFSYWSDTLEKAITSKYADNTISSEIFANCKKLTEVDYKAGNLTGLAKNNQEDDFATGLKVNVGKAVSSIDNNAFKNNNRLETITFDKDYAEGETPINLTIGENAFQDCTNLTGIEFPNRVTSIGSNAFKNAGNDTEEFSVTFERRKKADDSSVSVEYDVDLTIADNCFLDCKKLKTISLPIRLKELGTAAFSGTTGLTTMEIREDSEDARLKVIPSDCFLNSGLTSVTIPRSVTEIQGRAFQQCPNIESITFQEQNASPQEPLIIRSNAFAGGGEAEYKLKDVYVNINPEDRLLVCEYDAFSFTSLVGQTDVTSNQIATLHFDEAYWDYYAGDWKKGISFTQSDLNGFKDGYTNESKGYIGRLQGANPTVESNGKVTTNETIEIDGVTVNKQYTPANGWQQFALTTTGIDIIIPEGEFIRTYSTTKAYELPKSADGKTQYLHVYRVIRFDDGYQEGDDITSTEVANSRTRTAIAKEITANIPTNTGMIMVGKANSTILTYMKEIEITSEDEFPYTGTQEAEDKDNDVSNKNNLLKGTFDVEKTVLYPSIPYGSKNITNRIFSFRASDRRFLRVKPKTVAGPNKAYLDLPVALFHWMNEKGGTATDGTDASSLNANINLIITIEDETNGLRTIEMTSDGKLRFIDNEAYYTLQGVKVMRPSKGIYIHKGKKVVIK